MRAGSCSPSPPRRRGLPAGARLHFPARTAPGGRGSAGSDGGGGVERPAPHLPARRLRPRPPARQAAGPRLPLSPSSPAGRGRQPSAPPAPLSAELEARRLRGGLGPRPPPLLLAVEDPWARLGSGGATLNALLVAAEHLSARAGCTVRDLAPAGNGAKLPVGGWSGGGGQRPSRPVPGGGERGVSLGEAGRRNGGRLCRPC